MTDDPRTTHRPLPVVLRPVADELLSSWLVRHAAYYGVTGSFFAKWLMLGTRNLSVLDHRLGLAQVARLSEKLRCDPITLIAMTFVDAPGRSAELICRNRAPQICRACADRHAREGASGAIPKHWRKAWRVTCPACGAPLSDTNERPDARETLRDTSPFARLWTEALAGEAIIERFFHGDSSFDYSPDRAHARAARADLAALRREWSRPRYRLGARHDLSRIRRSRAAYQAQDQPCRRCGVAYLFPSSPFGGRLASDRRSRHPRRCSE